MIFLFESLTYKLAIWNSVVELPLPTLIKLGSVFLLILATIFSELVVWLMNNTLSFCKVDTPLMTSGNACKLAKFVWPSPATSITCSAPTLRQNNGVFNAEAPRLYAVESSGRFNSYVLLLYITLPRAYNSLVASKSAVLDNTYLLLRTAVYIPLFVLSDWNLIATLSPTCIV